MLHLFIALVLPYAAALVAWLFLRSKKTASAFFPDAFLLLVITVSVLLIPGTAFPVRALVGVSGLLILLRTHSYAVSLGKIAPINFLRFLSIGLLSPHLLYSSTRPAYSFRAPLYRPVLRIFFALLIIPITYTAAHHAILSAPSQNSWLLNHLILAAAFTVVMTAVGQLLTAIWELQHITDKVLVNKIFLSETPAEFWRCWSWPMHLWLYRHVYLPAGGKSRHLRATLAVFLISGLLHEFIAALVLGRITGHQTIFFLLSALGVLASPALEKFARHGPIAKTLTHLVTLTYLTAAAAFMFTTLHYITPLYYKKIWLMW